MNQKNKKSCLDEIVWYLKKEGRNFEYSPGKYSLTVLSHDLQGSKTFSIIPLIIAHVCYDKDLSCNAKKPFNDYLNKIIDMARKTISERAEQRGKEQEKSFSYIARYCNIAMPNKFFTKADTIKFMICLKIGRALNSQIFIEDDYIDAIAYYILLIEELGLHTA